MYADLWLFKIIPFKTIRIPNIRELNRYATVTETASKFSHPEGTFRRIFNHLKHSSIHLDSSFHSFCLDWKSGNWKTAPFWTKGRNHYKSFLCFGKQKNFSSRILYNTIHWCYKTHNNRFLSYIGSYFPPKKYQS